MLPSQIGLHRLNLCFAFFVAIVASLDISGDAIISRNWDCCKPSCSWKFKADVSQPVQSCGIDGKPVDPDAGSGCNDAGSAYQCPEQQPWAINDTFAYGFGGAFIRADLVNGKLEESWCCACYELKFKAESLKGKRMIVQATNTLYDKTDQNRFSLSVSLRQRSRMIVMFVVDQCSDPWK